MARVTDARLAQMRKQRRASLQDRCQIMPAVAAENDDETNAVKTWPSVSATVDCTVIRKPATPGGEAMELSAQDHWEVVVMDDVEVEVDTQIVPTTGRYTGRTLQTFDITRPGSLDLTNRVKCMEVVG